MRECDHFVDGSPLDQDRMEPERAEWITIEQIKLLDSADAAPIGQLSDWEINFRRSVRNQHAAGAILTPPQISRLVSIAGRRNRG